MTLGDSMSCMVFDGYGAGCRAIYGAPKMHGILGYSEALHGHVLGGGMCIVLSITGLCCLGARHVGWQHLQGCSTLYVCWIGVCIILV